MPSVASAMIAARFWASPTDAAMRPTSLARSAPRTFSITRTTGWTFTTPPTIPTCIGRVIFPTRWSPSRRHVAIAVYPSGRAK